MTRQSGNRIDRDHLFQGSPANSTFVETYPRYLCATDNAISATGIALATAIPLQSGDVVTNITFITGGTAASVPTAGFVALYSSAATPALLGQSADFATTARAANTAFTVALTTAFTVVADGLYYVSIAFAATTVPTLRGITTGNAAVAGAIGLSAKVLAQSHGSGLTGTAPGTIATPTTVATPCYFAVT